MNQSDMLAPICTMWPVPLALLAAGSISAQPTEVVDIGTRRELFVDEYLIERMDGVQLVLHQPSPREVAITHDVPWEGNTCCYHTVFRDDDVYRMYYRGSHFDQTTKSSPHAQVACYAESTDGIHWTRPELGLFEFDGSTANNIIWMGDIGIHNFAPFKDMNPDCKPGERYKAMGSGKGGLFAFVSPDAVRWSLMRSEPVITKGAFDSQNLAFWDSVRGGYVDFHRGFTEGVRAIMTCTSTDYVNWTDPVWLEYGDTPNEHLYTNQITAYYRAPHILMGFPKRFMPQRTFPGNRMPGLSDGVFMTSRDGVNFKRWTEAFIRPGLWRERWVNRNNMTAWGVVETASSTPGVARELSIYSTEGYYETETAKLRRFSLRLDGFVSLQAPLGGGEVVTRALKFAAFGAGVPSTADAEVQLLINHSTSAAGSVRCEILGEDGSPVPGFSLAEADEIFGDDIERAVSWQGRMDLKALAGRPLRLRFLLADADLYAFRFGRQEEGE